MISCKTIRSLTVAVAIAGTSFPMAALSETLPTRGPVSFSAYDQNGDGFVSKEEFNAVREKLMADGRPMRNALPFEDIDLNHDGKLSPEEYSAHQSARMGNSPRAGAGPGAGMRGMGMMPSFTEFDLNKDGKITEEEFTDARTARITKRLQEGYQMRGLANAPSFSDIDTNHDGSISPEEFSAQQAQHQQQMRP
jgi:Ca2+-binding EF-hand superfamily protein